MSKMYGHDNGHAENIGFWMSAKIYSDSKNGCSHCKGNEWKSVPIRGLKGYEAPVCAKCGEDPDLYVIVATVKDENGVKKRIKLRHNQDNIRLKNYVDVTGTLQQVLREIENNTFDVRKYESKESREAFIFEKVVSDYLEFHENRLRQGLLSPAGIKDKKTILKNHLMPKFKDHDIGAINDSVIRDFFNKFSGTLRMRDRALGELKTILYFAKDEQKKIQYVPRFPKIAASQMVSPDKFLTEEKQALVISKVENPVYQAAIKTLAIYALRPCEVRSLKWKDINFQSRVLYIQSHISLSKDIPGRKSQKNKVHILPIEDSFLEAISNIPRSINQNDYVFQGAHGGAIGSNTLTRAWNDACKLARVKSVSLYQGTKHSTLSNLGKTASDSQLRRFTGHETTKMIQRYSQSNLDDLRALLQ